MAGGIGWRNIGRGKERFRENAPNGTAESNAFSILNSRIAIDPRDRLVQGSPLGESLHSYIARHALRRISHKNTSW
jgi:hypothetical protein